jgi:hypothetical protein
LRLYEFNKIYFVGYEPYSKGDTRAMCRSRVMQGQKNNGAETILGWVPVTKIVTQGHYFGYIFGAVQVRLPLGGGKPDSEQVPIAQGLPDVCRLGTLRGDFGPLRGW